MFEKLKLMKERFAYLTDEISKPEVIADRELWQKLVKEHSDLETVIEKYDEYLAAEKSFEEAKELLSSGDDELKELAKAEFEEYKEKWSSSPANSKFCFCRRILTTAKTSLSK